MDPTDNHDNRTDDEPLDRLPKEELIAMCYRLRSARRDAERRATNIEHDDNAANRVKLVGQLLEVMLTEGVVEDTAIGNEACGVLADLNLVGMTTAVEVDGAKYRKLHFTPAGQLARGEETVTRATDIELARAVDKLQMQLNLELDKTRRDHYEPWLRGDVISLLAERDRLRPAYVPPSPEPAAPRAVVIADPQARVLERVGELLMIELEYLLPDREEVLVALRDGRVPSNRAGNNLAVRLEQAGLAMPGRPAVIADALTLELTALGKALVAVWKTGAAPW